MRLNFKKVVPLFPELEAWGTRVGPFTFMMVGKKVENTFTVSVRYDLAKGTIWLADENNRVLFAEGVKLCEQFLRRRKT